MVLTRQQLKDHKHLLGMLVKAPTLADWLPSDSKRLEHQDLAVEPLLFPVAMYYHLGVAVVQSRSLGYSGKPLLHIYQCSPPRKHLKAPSVAGDLPIPRDWS
jgi:hypothetical protein